MSKKRWFLPRTAGSNEAPHRLPLFDALKGAAILCVVYAHCLQYLGLGDYVHHPVVCLIYSFHMPLFMTLSGYFACPAAPPPAFITFVWRKTVRLLVPAVCFGLLTLAVMHLTGHRVRNGWIGYLYGNLWYLKSLFLCLLLARMAVAVLGNEIRAAIITILLSWFLPEVFHLAFMLPFFWFGYFLRKHSLPIGKIHATSILSGFMPIIVLLSGWMLLGMFWNGTHTTYLAPFGLIDYPKMQWAPHNSYSYLLRVSIGMAGTSCVLLLFAKFYSAGVRLLPLERIGRHTLAIYALQTLWMELMATCGVTFGYTPILYETIYCPAMTLLIVAVSYCMACAWHKLPFGKRV